MARCLPGQRFSAFLSQASGGRSLLLLLSPSRCKAPSLPHSRRAFRATIQAVASQLTAPLSDRAAPESNGRTGGVGGAGVTFQDAVVRLQEYWSSVGCTLWQPHNAEVGAGTMNPATFLRVVGPEGWKVCYVEPSVRPDDSRYGENPNRLQQHTQMQVILKPEPGNPQELYLGSLGALGIDTEKHDIRFVEDNWENPALGAWGLGWEVWMDGQEITQFTYFQQAGGQPLEFPSVEITYGLERILTALQGVDHFKDIQFNREAKYGDIHLQAEYEMSRFNLDHADIAIHQQLYELYEREAGNMLEKQLPLPAYQCLLKLSHVFNILDARGAVGVTQRAKCFATMRRLARSITELWLQRRAELEHPLGVLQAAPAQTPGKPDTSALPSATADLLVEVGCEELPPADIQAACEQLRAKAPGFLKKLALEHGEVSVHSTPRRLVLHVADTAVSQTSSEERLRGPPAKAAFGADGSPTKALAGFCKKNGVAEDGVTVEADGKGVEYVWAVKQNIGRPAAEVLTEELGALIGEISFKRSMRWNSRTAFSRPVRWLLAFLGPALLPFSFAGLRAGAQTYGPRQVGYLDVSDASDYWRKLGDAGIAGRREERKRTIWEGVQAAASGEGGRVSAEDSSRLLEEVTDLVESPRVLLGSFDSSFLRLPTELLTTVMRKHQRYFAVRDGEGQLMARFVTVANGDVDPETVIKGNEAVLRARFQDALFFYESDLRQELAAFKPALANITFQKDLGSMLDKSERVERVIPVLAELCGLAGAAEVALQAASLAKADLATSVVTEMTDLAGVIGRHYALRQGVDSAVAEAIFEAALPRQAGDALPTTSAGVLCSVADRLDSLVGLFAAGHAPTATADIYGLRRAAYGMLETLLSSGTRLDLAKAIAAAAEAQPLAVSEESRAAVFEFLARRVEQLMVDRGVSVQVARAVLNERSRDVLLAWTSAQDLQAEVDRKEGGRLQTAVTILSRPVRLVKVKEIDAAVDPALFAEQEEKDLFEAAEAVAAKVHADMSIPEFLQAAAALEQPVTSFFDKIFVMCEDVSIRNNRIALLQKLARLPKGIVDLTALPGQ